MTKTKKIIRNIITAFLCIVFLVYILYHIVDAFSAKTELFTVTRATVKNTVELSGYIFRDETVIFPKAGGVQDIEIRDGEKIAKSAVIASSYYVKSDEIQNRLYEIAQKKEILEKSRLSGTIDIEETDRKINEIRTQTAIRRDDAAFLKYASEELLILINKRALAIEEKENYSNDIALLDAEKTLLLSALGQGEPAESPVSGYFYSYTDGGEGIFTLEAAENISKESFSNIISTELTEYKNVIGKVASGFKWYFICLTDMESAEEIVADKKYKCVFSDNTYKEEIQMTVEKKIVDYSDKTAIISFSSTINPENFDFSRRQRISVTVSETSGLKVPVPSVRVIGENTGVYILYDGVARIRNINILSENGGYYIVEEPESKSKEWLYLYDRIIIGEKNLYDGKVID